MNVQAPSPETADQHDDAAPALATLANPRRVRWSALYSADHDGQ